MSPAARVPVLALAASLSVAPLARAQLGEVQPGIVGSYGTCAACGAGGGLVLGVAAGRLTYVGLRWTWHGGATTSSGAAPALDVRNRLQTFVADLGVLIPVGAVEVMPEISLGMVRFTQRERPGAGGGNSTRASHSDEFLAAPGVALEVHAGRVALIPEVQFMLAGDPGLPRPVRHRGLTASLRVVLPIEVGRVTH